MKACLLTVGSYPDHPGLARLRKSAARHGWPLEVVLITAAFAVELNMPWYPWGPTDFKTKLLGVRDKLPDLKKSGYTHVVFTDAYDVIVEGPYAALKEACAKAGYDGTGAIIGCEKACYPQADRAGLYPPIKSASPYKYVNSGGYLAEIDFTGDVLLARISNDPNEDGDDQLFLSDRYLVQFLPDAEPLDKQRIILDNDANIFQTLAHHVVAPDQKWEDYFEIRDGRVWNLTTGSAPLLFHGNGGGSRDNYHSWLPSFNC